MRVLHIGSTAGVAEMLCKEDDLVLQLEDLDKYGFGDFYKKTIIFKDPDNLIHHAKGIENLYDYVIIHDLVEFENEFRNPIMFWHGSKLRQLKYWAKTCFVSTPDLLKYCDHAYYIPQPIDLDLFKPREGLEREFNEMSIVRGYNHEDLKSRIHQKFPYCHIVNRSDDFTQYENMPYILNHIKNYIEAKYTYDRPPKLLPSSQWSCTALQAKACDCTVTHLDGTLLPKELLKLHDRKVVMEKFRKCLEDLNYLRN